MPAARISWYQSSCPPITLSEDGKSEAEVGKEIISNLSRGQKYSKIRMLLALLKAIPESIQMEGRDHLVVGPKDTHFQGGLNYLQEISGQSVSVLLSQITPSITVLRLTLSHRKSSSWQRG